MRKKNLDNSDRFSEKQFANVCSICLSLLTIEQSNVNWKCSENCNILTKRAPYDSGVFKIFLNIIKISIFIEQNN